MARPNTVADVRAMLRGQKDAPKPTESKATAQGTAPFDGYDDLNVEQVVARLAEMDEAERATVRTYETANRKRKGVLEALED